MIRTASLLACAALALAGCGAQQAPLATPQTAAAAPAAEASSDAPMALKAEDCASDVAIEQALCLQRQELASQRDELDRQGEALARVEASLARQEQNMAGVAVFNARRRNAFGSCDGPIDSKGCIRTANRLCRQRGFAAGRVVDTDVTEVVTINTIACVRPRF